MRKMFASPEEWKSWLSEQSDALQVEIAATVKFLTDTGLPPFLACHFAYDIVMYAAVEAGEMRDVPPSKLN